MKLVVLALLFAFSTVTWGQIHVPGDYPDPQTAVDNASPGDVIVVHGGTWTGVAPFPALTIDKPLTLIGDPPPSFRPPFDGSGQQPPAIRLAGPGSGTVVLARVDLSGQTSGITWSNQSGGLTGGGFAEVHVYDSTIAAPAWVLLTGIGAGSSGIDVTTPYLLISGSSVSASDAVDDGCYGFGLDGKPGVRCSGTVVALDSTIAGASYRNPCFPTPGCAPIPGGDGGAGIEAARVDEAGSALSGGPGASWSDVLGTPCGSAADGPPVLATTHVTLANDLTVARPTSIGGSVALSWNTAGPSLQIYYSRGPSAPYTVLPGYGQAYLKPVGVHFLGTYPAGGGVHSVTLPVPALQVLVGVEFTFQAVNPPSTVTRPVSIVLGL